MPLAKLVLTVALILSSTMCLSAATWFVDQSATGSSQTGSSSQPFLTVQQAADVAQAGDIINIRPGTYRETVRPANSGISGNNIIFQKDPATTGDVVVSGADLVTGWTLDSTHSSGKLYKAAMPWNLNPDNDDPDFGTISGNQLFVDGRMVIEARWPNTGSDISLPDLCHSDAGDLVDSNTGWLENEKLTGLPQGTTLAGAIIHMSPGQSWNNYTANVTSISGNRINFNGQLHQESYALPSNETPFYIYGKKELLDQAGEWWFDESNQEVYLWTPTGVAPSNLTVESKRRIFAFDLSDRNYITIKDIKIFSASITTTRRPNNTWDFSNHSSGVVLDSIEAKYVSHTRNLPGSSYWTNMSHTTGILLVGSGHEIKNSVLSYSSGNLLLCVGNGNLVENNVIHDANYHGADTANINLGHFNADSKNHIVQNNTAYRSGRSIILVRTIKNTQIKHNHLYVSNLQSTDVGAIYMYDNDSQGSEIAYNIVQDIAGPKHGGAGIYMDERSQDVRIHHNLIFNSQGGIRLNEPRQMRVYNNTIIAGETSLGGMYNNQVNPYVTWDVYEGVPNYIRNNIFANVYEFRKATFSNNVPNTQPDAWNSYTEGSWVPRAAPYDDPAPDFRFVNPADGNFQLQSGSVAINAGTTGTDSGYTIPAYLHGGNNGAPDAGAFEYGRTPWTAGANITTEPDAPSNLRLVSQNGSSFELAWDDNSSNETAFYVERSGDYRTFEVVAMLPPNTTTYTDIIQPNLYYYRVRADKSAFSPVLTVNPGRSALARFEIENFDETGGGDGGVQIQGVGVTDFDPGEYILFKNVSFTSDINKFIVYMTAGYDGPFEFRLDSPTAPIVASFTGPAYMWGEPYQAFEGQVSGFPDGTHDLYITTSAPGHPGNIDWFTFSNGQTAPNGVPSNLTENNGQLTWLDNSTNELGFKIQQSSDNILWHHLATVGENITSYNAAPNKFYRVQAYNVMGVSEYSNVAGWTLNATPETDTPRTPASLTATSSGATSVMLNWQDMSSIEDGYKVERSTSPSSGFTQIATLSANSTSYPSGSLTTGTTYYYRVRAYKGTNNSLYSNTASATPVAPIVIDPPYAYEDFENGLNGGEGWAANWDLGGRYLNEAAALSYGTLFSTNTASAESNWLNASRSLASPVNYNDSVVWLACLVNMKSDTDNNDAGGMTVIVNDGVAEEIQLQMTLGVGGVTNHYLMDGGTQAWNATTGSINTTYLYVLKLSDSGSNTTAHVWRYSGGNAPDTEPDEATATELTAASGQGMLQNITFDAWGLTVGFDELRIANSYQGAIGITSDTQPSGYASWAASNITNGGDASQTGDADGDGVPNLIEYALGLNPIVPDSGGLPQLSQTGSNLLLSLTRNTAVTDVNLIVERSSTPAFSTVTTVAQATSGGTFTASVSGISVSNGSDSTVQIYAPKPSQGEKVFFRLRVVEQ